MLKAIQTRYAGYLFRSRLEARWAVFFDALGLKWEYEPEGFELPSGRYLPDFRVCMVDGNGDSWTFWFEVKPETGGDFAKAKELCAAMDQDPTHPWHPVILLSGLPEAGRTYPDAQGLEWWLWCSHRERPWHNDYGNWSHEIFYVDYQRGNLRWEQRAVDAARSARFEFGQSGATR